MSSYIKYVIENVEPFSIVDIHNSKSDEAAALSYIPGSTIRGLLMNVLNRNDELKTIKKHFYDGTVIVCNAYPQLVIEDEKVTCVDTFPTPLGFYEDRQASGSILHTFKEVEKGEDNPFAGMKRAKTGKFAYIKDNKLFYTTPQMGESFKIRLARNNHNNSNEQPKQQLFRGDYVEAGQKFVGYIRLEDRNMEDIICSCLSEPNLHIGNARTSGFGHIKVETNILAEGVIPFNVLSNKGQVEGDESYLLDMLCLSHMCMVNDYQEPCGINVDVLAAEIGCKSIEMVNAASSIVQISGFNRITGGRTATFPMFQGGSMFRLRCSGKPDLNKMRKLEDQGIGILREEGFGRILFVNAMDGIVEKIKCVPFQKHHMLDEELISKKIYIEDVGRMKKQAAKSILKAKIKQKTDDYIIKNVFDKGTASKSQRGTVLMMCKSLHYEPEKAVTIFNEYFSHIRDKESRKRVHVKGQKTQSTLEGSISYILNSNFFDLIEFDQKNTICGYSLKDLLVEDKNKSLNEAMILYKINLIEEMIRYANRKEK